jgi:hypothetical protein
MKSWIETALRALAEHDREKQASEDVETRLIAAFRQKRTRKKWKFIVPAGLAAAAAAGALFFVRPREHSKPVAVAPARVIQEPVPVAATPQVRPSRAGKRPRKEIMTEFFPLLDAPPPFERGELVRVMVPVAMMRTVGLPVNEERLSDQVYADVLVGEEGLARAIRFVSYE